MDNMSQNEENRAKIKDEAAAIKEDIKHLVEKLKNIKDYSMDSLHGSLEDLMSTVKESKHKILHQGAVAEIYISTRQHPIRNLTYAFLVGALVTMLCCKKK